MLPIVDLDRATMGFSLAVHIVLASLGVALPVIILALEFLGIRKKDDDYTNLARRLTIVFVILFAVGSASGILVSLELFLLWPKFMTLVGQVAILPVYVEVFAFFMETIFLGIYVYSWDKFRGDYSHLLLGIPIAIGGGLSSVFITMLNAFMNTPVGFNIPAYLANGVVTGVNPFAVFTSPAMFLEVSHATAAAYFGGTMLVAGYFAYRILKTRKSVYYRKALAATLAIAVIAVAFTIATGVMSIQNLGHIQPEKYAAIEGNLQTEANAPELIGGIPTSNTTLGYYIAIPGLESILYGGNTSSVVPGLNSYPQSTWPPLIVHIMFDIMFFLGIGIAIVLAIFVLRQITKKDAFRNKPLLYLIGLCGLLGIMIVEVGWIMAEFARQPWIIYQVMTVSQAANYSPAILPIMIGILVFYIMIIPLTIVIMHLVLKRNPL